MFKKTIVRALTGVAVAGLALVAPAAAAGAETVQPGPVDIQIPLLGNGQITVGSNPTATTGDGQVAPVPGADATAPATAGADTVISPPGAAVAAVVVTAREDLEIAAATRSVLGGT